MNAPRPWRGFHISIREGAECRRREGERERRRERVASLKACPQARFQSPLLVSSSYLVRFSLCFCCLSSLLSCRHDPRLKGKQRERVPRGAVPRGARVLHHRAVFSSAVHLGDPSSKAFFFGGEKSGKRVFIAVRLRGGSCGSNELKEKGDGGVEGVSRGGGMWREREARKTEGEAGGP